MVWREPVRGAFPPPQLFALSGIEQMRAYAFGAAPVPPVARLLGMVLTQVSPGSTTWTLPASLWLMSGPTIMPEIALSNAMGSALQTTAPPAHRTAAVSVNHRAVRPAEADGSSIVVRADVSYTSRGRGVATAQMEDSRGRLLAHASMSADFEAISPPPAPGEIAPVEVPLHKTPDPHARPVTDEARAGVAAYAACLRDGLAYVRDVAEGRIPRPPFSMLTGLEVCGVEEGAVSTKLPVTGWLAALPWEVDPGVLHYQLATSMGLAAATRQPPGLATYLLDTNVTYLRSVTDDSGPLVARAEVTHENQQRAAARADVIDGAGNLVAVGNGTLRYAEPRSIARAGAASTRTLATVLFTDLVSSTEHAARLGDESWRRLLEEHHAAVRRELATYGGREIKTTGDGFLATFDSPGRAVHCARAAREAIRRLGLELTAGLHTGECEVSGDDISGITVHIAARVHQEAAPGEVLVSGTVRDLCTGSGLRFADRGRHRLKGLEGEWSLFALEG